ncbi:hypothetical protein RN001_013171 [Aquatica leii]|uniref:Uncharacterized protein n=1 Tax=Aquatica leii TaxID=1421715 RepID=A0AAN7S6V8_9COLE|nr:hypothetical protein RN001_013171 [Aquatica leii]
MAEQNKTKTCPNLDRDSTCYNCIYFGHKDDVVKHKANSNTCPAYLKNLDAKISLTLQLRKQNIQKGLKLQIRLIVDVPKIEGGFGNSNDGNTARGFLANSFESAQILGLDVELLNRAHIVMQVLSCGYVVNVEFFKKYCLKTAKMLVQSFSWYCMPTSIHEVLI